MKDYVEDYKYNNCFWKKSGVLYEHSDSKFKEYMSIGQIFKYMSKKIFKLSEKFGGLKKMYAKPKEPNYTRENGIEVILSSITIIKNEFHKLAIGLGDLARKILEREDAYKSKAEPTKMCDDAYKKYDNELIKLSNVKKSYFDTMNKVVESHLNQKYSKKGESNKAKQELNNKLKQLSKKKEEYKQEIELVEKLRTDYMEEQGNIFADKEELERECTHDLRKYFQTYIK